MNSKNKGLISESKISTRFLELGYIVLKPMGDNARYDLVIEKRGEFFRVQCKTARTSGNGSIKFNTVSVVSKAGGVQVTKPYNEEADFFAAYSPDTRECYLVPVEKAAKSAFQLRLEIPQNNQEKGINWASDFIL